MVYLRIRPLISLFIASMIMFSFAGCYLEHYSSGNGVRIKIDFSARNSYVSSNVRYKPQGAGENYVPGFVDRIELLVTGRDLATNTYSEYKATNTRIGDAKVSNEMDLGKIPYGIYDINVSAFVRNERNLLNKDILVYRGNISSQTIGGIFENQSLTVNIEKMPNEKGIVLDEESIVFNEEDNAVFMIEGLNYNSTTFPKSGHYSVALDSSGEFTVGYVTSINNGPINLMFFNAKGDLKSSIENLQYNGLILPGASVYNFPFAYLNGNLILPYRLTQMDGSQRINIAVFNGSTIEYSKQILDHTGNIVATYIDSKFGKTVLAFSTAAPNRILLLPLDGNLNTTLKAGMGSYVTFPGSNCRFPSIKILDEERFIIASYCGILASPSIIAQVFFMNGEPASELFTVHDNIGEFQYMHLQMSVVGDSAYRFIYNLLRPLSDTSLPELWARIKGTVTDSNLNPIEGREYFSPVISVEGNEPPYQSFGAIAPSQKGSILVWADNSILPMQAENRYSIYYDVLGESGQTESTSDKLLYFDDAGSSHSNHDIIDPRISINEDGFAVITAIHRKYGDYASTSLYLKRILF